MKTQLARPSADDADSIDARILEIAGRQHGVISRNQLISTGIGGAAVSFRVRRRRLRVLHRGVYLVGPAVAPRIHEWAAVLACGGGTVVSHQSAAVLWDLRPAPSAPGPVEVTLVGQDRGRRAGIRAHRVRNLAPDEVTAIEGLPVTTAERTLLDLAGAIETRALEQAFAVAERNSLVSEAGLRRLLSRYPRRPGSPALLRLLDDEVGPAFTRSQAEETFLGLIRRSGLPRPEVNVVVGGYEVDLLWRHAGLVAELDGYAFHASRPRFERDRLRDATLVAQGYRVMRITWRQIQDEPEGVIVRLARGLDSASVAQPPRRGHWRGQGEPALTRESPSSARAEPT